VYLSQPTLYYLLGEQLRVLCCQAGLMPRYAAGIGHQHSCARVDEADGVFLPVCAQALEASWLLKAAH
jgi:hypothetical protein